MTPDVSLPLELPPSPLNMGGTCECIQTALIPIMMLPCMAKGRVSRWANLTPQLIKSDFFLANGKKVRFKV